MNNQWKFYKDAENQWRWRHTASNGNIVGASTEGYVKRADCAGNAHRNGCKGKIVTSPYAFYPKQEVRIWV